jgi:cardiolipin synthase
MNMNVPNSLTILRILLIPVYVGLLNYEQFDYALAILFIAGLTDALDGTIARVANQRTKLGEVLDPLADKLLLTTGFITLSVMHFVPLWITILVTSRDLMLMLGAAVAHFTDTPVDISPTALGKGTTLIQLTTLVAIVFFASRRMDLAVLDPLLYVMGCLTLLSGLHYLSRGYCHVTSGQA